ncbi:MAG: signal recognition particle protein Srp54 [Candidatus Aenigmatarchaeota archaeon]
MLDKLGEGLRSALKKLAGAGSIDKAAVDELAKDIQRALLSGDVDVRLAQELADRIRKRSLDEKPKPGQTAREHVVRVVYEELVRLVGSGGSVAIKPGKILLCGLFGSGKTTTAGKLARFYQKRGLKPALVACDVVRPAAYEQLKQLSEQVHAGFYGEKGEKDSAKVLRNALQKLKADVIIIDSSGRDALDGSMINELKTLNEIAKPDERILVIPADLGQAARVQADAFQKAVHITGVIITKLDGTAKGGGALTAAAVTGAPVKWIGTGEKSDALEVFEPDRFVSRLIGWGDIQALVEKAKEAIAPEKAEKMVERMMESKFTLDDFYEQIKAMQNMGPLGDVLGMMPGGMKLPKNVDVSKQEGKMKKWKYAIESMTPAERADPSIITPSRILRISKGSGVPEADIRELLKGYEQTKRLMKQLGGGAGMKRGALANLAKRFKGLG